MCQLSNLKSIIPTLLVAPTLLNTMMSIFQALLGYLKQKSAA